MKSRGAPALSGRWLVLEISVWRLCLVVGKGKKAAGRQLPPQLQLLQPPLIVIIPITPLLNCGGNDSCSIPYKARRNPTAVQAMTSFLFISSWNQRWIGWNDRMQNCINGEQRVSDEDKLSKSFFYLPSKSTPHLFLVLFQVRGSPSCFFILQSSCIQLSRNVVQVKWHSDWKVSDAFLSVPKLLFEQCPLLHPNSFRAWVVLMYVFACRVEGLLYLSFHNSVWWDLTGGIVQHAALLGLCYLFC